MARARARALAACRCRTAVGEEQMAQECTGQELPGRSGGHPHTRSSRAASCSVHRATFPGACQAPPATKTTVQHSTEPAAKPHTHQESPTSPAQPTCGVVKKARRPWKGAPILVSPR